MENRNLDKAMDLLSALLSGKEVRRDKGEYRSLYEEYLSDAQVYDLVHAMTKRMNLCLYEYDGGLYLTAGEENRVFGYSNEELKRVLGLRLNRELYLCYFLIYHVITAFYNDSANPTFLEYIRIEDLIKSVDASLTNLLSDLKVLVRDEIEENSFETLALLWEDLPIMSGEEGAVARAAKNSKSGYAKTVFNFLEAQGLLTEAEGRYYPTGRFRALIGNYFEEHRGRLYELLNGKEEIDDAADQPDSGQ